MLGHRDGSRSHRLFPQPVLPADDLELEDYDSAATPLVAAGVDDKFFFRNQKESVLLNVPSFSTVLIAVGAFDTPGLFGTYELEVSPNLIRVLRQRHCSQGPRGSGG